MLNSTQLSKSLGELKYGKPTTFNFPIVNEGSRPIEITKIVVGCGSCTTARAIKTKLNPNEQTDISVTFTPGSTGSQKKHVTIRYDESDALRLEFTAEVYA